MQLLLGTCGTLHGVMVKQAGRAPAAAAAVQHAAEEWGLKDLLHQTAGVPTAAGGVLAFSSTLLVTDQYQWACNADEEEKVFTSFLALVATTLASLTSLPCPGFSAPTR